MLTCRVLLPVLCVASLAAQGTMDGDGRTPWRWQPVDGAGAVVVAVCWSSGLVDDAPAESGAANALAEYRLLRARAAAPDVTASGVRVVADASVVHVRAEAGATADLVAFCRALLDDRAPFDDELAVRAIARAALAADDADWLYPGPILVGRARRSLLAGAAAHGVAGSATAIQRLTPQRLRELLALPVPVQGFGLGAIAPSLREAIEALPLPQGQKAPLASDGFAPVPAGVDVQPHPRLEGPFAALAFAAAAAEPVALAVGVEVARMRAARALPLRGREALARAPVVGWSWLDGDRLMVLTRRGADGAGPDRAFAELDALVADLRERPPTVAECDSARRTLRWEWGLLPMSAGTDAAALPGRAVAVLLAARRGATEAGLAAVTPDAAHAALRAVCVPGAAWRGALVPAAPLPSR